jgi:hypothetical protein
MKKNTRTLLSLALAAAVTAAFSGCTSDGGANDPNAPMKQGAAQMLSAKSGDNYVYIHNSGNGWGVYEDTNTGKYLALNWQSFQVGESYDTFSSSNTIYNNLKVVDNSHEVYNPYGGIYDPNTGTYSGSYDWVTQIDYIGGGFTFEDAPAHQKDLEAYRGQAKAQSISQLKGTYMSQYGLSDARASEVANMVNSWTSLNKQGEMTKDDVSKFSTAVLGADLARFQSAAQKAVKGDTSDLKNLTAVAAKTNGVSTEQAAKILSGLVK